MCVCVCARALRLIYMCMCVIKLTVPLNTNSSYMYMYTGSNMHITGCKKSMLTHLYGLYSPQLIPGSHIGWTDGYLP